MKPRPAAAITTASALAEALHGLLGTGIHPDLPLAGHAAVLSLLQDTASLLADSLQTEARLTGTVLRFPLGISGTLLADAADSAHAELTRAGRLADAAADHLHRSHREATATAGRGAEGGSSVLAIRHAREAANRAADLADVLAATERQPDSDPAAALALITGHLQITESLTWAITHLAERCRRLREPLADAFSQHGPQARQRAARATDPLDDAAYHLDQARRNAHRAQETLTHGLALHRTGATVSGTAS
jgi:hypothetical protein